MHIWHFAYINFRCVASRAPNLIEIRECEAENSVSVCWFDMEWLPYISVQVFQVVAFSDDFWVLNVRPLVVYLNVEINL
jgi:hypothetical protein